MVFKFNFNGLLLVGIIGSVLISCKFWFILYVVVFMNCFVGVFYMVGMVRIYWMFFFRILVVDWLDSFFSMWFLKNFSVCVKMVMVFSVLLLVVLIFIFLWRFCNEMVKDKRNKF